MAVKKYITNMAKKEIFETICIFFCDRLKTKIKEFEKLKTTLLNVSTGVNTEEWNLTFYQAGADLTSWNYPQQICQFIITSFTPNGYCVRESHVTNNPLNVLPRSFERISSSHLKSKEYFLTFVWYYLYTQHAQEKGRINSKAVLSAQRSGQSYNLTSVFSC